MVRYLRELVRHRDLLFWLAAKEIKVRYKSPVLGVLWALLVPLLVSLILWVIFTWVMPVPKMRYPFFLFLIVAMFPWSFFSQSVSAAVMSVLEAGPLIKKHAFPRALIPLSVVAAHLFNFVVALAVVLGILFASGLPVSRWVWLLPVVIGLHVALTTGVALLVAGLQVRYRDVKYLTEVGLVLWFYLTPIFYPLELVLHAPPVLGFLYLLNPLVWVVELYRIALLGGSSGPMFLAGPLAVGTAAVVSVGICTVGLSIFRRYEPTFADWVMG